MKRKSIIIGCIIAIGSIIFLGKKELLNEYFSSVKLQFLKGYLHENYLYDIEEDNETEGIYSGYLEALQNRETYYLDKEALKSAKISDEGDYYGVGITSMWSLDEHYLMVIGVKEHSPADEEGVKPGDKIIQIDDVKAISVNSAKLSKLLYGDPKKATTYKIQRGSKNFEVKLTPKQVSINELEYEIINNVLYIKLHAIKKGTSNRVKELLEETNFQKTKGVILDIRDLTTNNVKEISALSDLFLDQGVAFKIQSKKEGVVSYNTEEGSYDMPLKLIINTGTSSGAEALVLALEDRAETIGSTTSGDGYIRKLITFEDGTGMSVASGMISDRYGEQLSEKGIEPNERLYISEEEKIAWLDKGQITKEEDTYLQRALEKFQ